jgi:hypothetical protein
MLGNLDGQIEAARARRALALANSVPMASRFDPRLPGSPTPQPQRPIRPSAIDPGPLPDNDEDIAFAPLTRLSQWIAQKKTVEQAADRDLSRPDRGVWPAAGMLRHRDGRALARAGRRCRRALEDG